MQLQTDAAQRHVAGCWRHTNPTPPSSCTADSSSTYSEEIPVLQPARRHLSEPSQLVRPVKWMCQHAHTMNAMLLQRSWQAHSTCPAMGLHPGTRCPTCHSGEAETVSRLLGGLKAYNCGGFAQPGHRSLHEFGDDYAQTPKLLENHPKRATDTRTHPQMVSSCRCSSYSDHVKSDGVARQS